MTTINEARLPALILQSSVVLLAIATATGFLFYTAPVGLGILAGGSIAIINFVWQRRTLRQLLDHQIAPSAGSAAVRYLLRLSITAVILYAVLTSGRFSIIALLVGLSVIVAVIIALTLYSAFYKGD
ncbi:ATP synthase I chain [Trichlorobacter thiogenes]|uniref:ATP synthase I chain n=1 Tax=Trichlorobacter thiogenes TaxID=115783 RepID=A0A1T4M485_9BACT|nr:ATP synthase subunit I [Trichlorobacter thiogenes]SJZ61809.1 ATP synthase I chain [Trichlorobacter thiogenes]